MISHHVIPCHIISCHIISTYYDLKSFVSLIFVFLPTTHRETVFYSGIVWCLRQSCHHQVCFLWIKAERSRIMSYSGSYLHYVCVYIYIYGSSPSKFGVFGQLGRQRILTEPHIYKYSIWVWLIFFLEPPQRRSQDGPTLSVQGNFTRHCFISWYLLIIWWVVKKKIQKYQVAQVLFGLYIYMLIGFCLPFVTLPSLKRPLVTANWIFMWNSGYTPPMPPSSGASSSLNIRPAICCSEPPGGIGGPP